MTAFNGVSCCLTINILSALQATCSLQSNKLMMNTVKSPYRKVNSSENQKNKFLTNWKIKLKSRPRHHDETFEILPKSHLLTSTQTADNHQSRDTKSRWTHGIWTISRYSRRYAWISDFFTALNYESSGVHIPSFSWNHLHYHGAVKVGSHCMKLLLIQHKTNQWILTNYHST